MIFTVTDPRPHPPTPFQLIAFTSIYNPEYTNHAEVASKCGEILQNITVNKEESTNVEELTRNQSLSTKWYKYREDRLAASHFYDICHTSTPSVFKHWRWETERRSCTKGLRKIHGTAHQAFSARRSTLFQQRNSIPGFLKLRNINFSNN